MIAITGTVFHGILAFCLDEKGSVSLVANPASFPPHDFDARPIFSRIEFLKIAFLLGTTLDKDGKAAILMSRIYPAGHAK